MKRLTALLLILGLLLALAACGELTTQSTSLEDLVGKWQTVYQLGEEETDELLEYYGFTEEERDVIDDDVFQLAEIFTVNSDRTYSFALEGEQSRSLLRQSFNKILSQVFEHREELFDTYGEEIMDIEDLAEFKERFAGIYDYGSYDEYLDAAVEHLITVYYDMSSPIELETGTFTLETGMFSMTVDGESTAENLSFTLTGNTLLLTYSDGEELYTRLGN